MCEHDDYVKLVYLWSLQEMRGRRPAKIEPPKWTSRKRNIDSFLLFAKLRRLPKVPTFADAVIQQKQVINDFSTSEVDQADLPAGILNDLPDGIWDGIVDKNPRGREDQGRRDSDGISSLDDCSVSRGMCNPGTSCYRVAVPPLVSPIGSDNFGNRGMDSLGTLCYRSTIPQPVQKGAF